MSKPEPINDDNKGSVEPDKTEETPLVDSGIQDDPIQDALDDDMEDEDEPSAANDSPVSKALGNEPETKETPTTEDFKRAINTAFKEKAERWGQKFRNLNVKERDLLFALYEKWNGNMSEMILDKDCPFKGYTQINHYANLYFFKERLVEKRKENAERTMSMLKDAKTLAIENAIRLLEKRHTLVFNRYGVQLFDNEGNPLIVEKLPYYKEIKAAWEIIKTEMGEATAIAKADVTSGGKPIQGNTIVFKSFKQDAPSS